MAQIIEYNNPFDPSDRTIYPIWNGPFIDWLKINFPQGFGRPVIVYVNGDIIDVKQYEFEMGSEDTIEIRPHVEDPGTIAFLINLAIVAVVATTAAYIAIQLLPDPELPSSIPGGPSPTYNLRAQNNQARVGEAIPVIYGRHRIYPDLAAVPWVEYIDDNQFLYQLFMIGQGEFEVEEIRIDDTPIDEFSEITTEIVEPGDFVTLFDDNIVTAVEVSSIRLRYINDFVRQDNMRFKKTDSSIEMLDNNVASDNFARDWAISFKVGDLIRVARTNGQPTDFDGDFEIASIDSGTPGLLTVTDASSWSAGVTSIETMSVRLISAIDENNESAATPFFTVNPAGSLIDEIQVDYEFPNGLFFLNSDNEYTPQNSSLAIRFQEIDDLGVDIGIEQAVSDFLNLQTPNAVRRTVKIAVSPGRYKVKLRQSLLSDMTRQSSDVHVWTGLKGRLENIQNYGQMTLLATKSKATNQLSPTTSKKFNVIVTRKLPIWNGSSFDAPVATRSPAWAISDIWMASYGLQRSLCDLDTDGLLVLDGIWAARGDFFDGVFDQQISAWEGMTRVARVGRAKPIITGSLLSIVRDQTQTVRTAMFNQRNIIRNSLNVSYTFDDNRAPDGTRIKYIDKAVYKEDVVQPLTEATRPREVFLFGCTEYEQAFREALYMDAAFKFQRRQITFETELDGHNVVFGDLVGIQHHMPRWAQGGEVTAVSGLELTLSERIDFSIGGPFSITLRKKDGTVDGPIVVTQVPSPGDNKVLLAAPASFTILTDLNTERTYFSFGKSSFFIQDVVITEVTPRGNKRVSISCVNYDQAIHDADTGVIPPQTPVPFPVDDIPPNVTGLLLSNVPGSGVVTAKWNPAFTNLDNFRVERSTDNISFSLEATPSSSTLTEDLNATGLLYVRVAGVTNSIIGSFTVASITAS